VESVCECVWRECERVERTHRLRRRGPHPPGRPREALACVPLEAESVASESGSEPGAQGVVVGTGSGRHGERSG